MRAFLENASHTWSLIVDNRTSEFDSIARNGRELQFRVDPRGDADESYAQNKTR